MTARARTPEDLETPAIAAALRRLVGAHHTHGGLWSVSDPSTGGGVWAVGADGYCLAALRVWGPPPFPPEPESTRGARTRVVERWLSRDPEGHPVDGEALLAWCGAVCEDCEDTRVQSCECKGTGEITCTCSWCDDEHVTTCPDCDGDGRTTCDSCRHPASGVLLGRLWDRHLIRLVLTAIGTDGLSVHLDADSLVLRAPGRLGVVMGMRGGIKAHYPRFEAQP